MEDKVAGDLRAPITPHLSVGARSDNRLRVVSFVDLRSPAILLENNRFLQVLLQRCVRLIDPQEPPFSMIRFLLISHFLILTALPSTQSTGPEKGTLMIVGGGAMPHLAEPFFELIGGKDAPIVFIPTASGDVPPERYHEYATRWTEQGATNVIVIHTTDPAIANTEAFVKPIREAKAVWFGGGRQWRLVDAYKGTLTERALWDLLDRGGVIGGSSAGATIQGSYLARGDTRNNQIMTGDHEEGFGFVKNIAIDQHHLARNRHFDMFAIRSKYPDLLGIGIDEGTAVIVRGNQFEVIGNGYVTIYDDTFWSSEGSSLKSLPPKEFLFYFLKPGDRYDLENRTVIQGR